MDFFRYNIVVLAYHVVSRPLASLHEKQRTQIQDMLPQQYYNEKKSIFLTSDFS